MSSDNSQQSLSTPQPLYDYHMIQLPANYAMAANQIKGNEIGQYVQDWANKLATDGWEFYRIDTMGVTANPGCLAGLFGQSQTHTQYSIMTFRRRK